MYISTLTVYHLDVQLTNGRYFYYIPLPFVSRFEPLFRTHDLLPNGPFFFSPFSVTGVSMCESAWHKNGILKQDKGNPFT